MLSHVIYCIMEDIFMLVTLFTRLFLALASVKFSFWC